MCLPCLCLVCWYVGVVCYKLDNAGKVGCSL